MSSTDACPCQPQLCLSLMAAPYMQPIPYARLLAAAVDSRPSSWPAPTSAHMGTPIAFLSWAPLIGPSDRPL